MYKQICFFFFEKVEKNMTEKKQNIKRNVLGQENKIEKIN